MIRPSGGRQRFDFTDRHTDWPGSGLAQTDFKTNLRKILLHRHSHKQWKLFIFSAFSSDMPDFCIVVLLLILLFL